MQAIYRSNLDLDIVLSPKEIAHGLKCLLGRDFPILKSDVVNEQGEKVGNLRLQRTATWPLGIDVEESRGIFFIKDEPQEWFIQLDGGASIDLREQKNLTRRLPYHNSQLWIYQN